MFIVKKRTLLLIAGIVWLIAGFNVARLGVLSYMVIDRKWYFYILSVVVFFAFGTICKYEKDEHDIPSSVLVELAKVLHTTPNYLLLGDIEEDDWLDDMIQILQKISKPEYRELAKKIKAVTGRFWVDLSAVLYT